VELKNHATLACLDDSEHGLRMWSCNASPHQSWRVRKFAAHSEFRNQHTGLCLDDSHQFEVRTHPCSDVPSDHQRWY
jgi:Ricin-type beta-trefoil lectin domain